MNASILQQRFPWLGKEGPVDTAAAIDGLKTWHAELVAQAEDETIEKYREFARHAYRHDDDLSIDPKGEAERQGPENEADDDLGPPGGYWLSALVFVADEDVSL